MGVALRTGEAMAMRAVAVTAAGDAATLEVVSVPRPVPGPGQILIEVAAAGLNRADLRRTQAHFKVDGPVIAGLEVSGVVAALGDGASGFAVGDRVAAMAPGGYAEFAVADDVSAFHLPDGVSFRHGAALATWYMTAHDALVTAGGFRQGDTVLVTAAKSGIGIATAQCARALGAGKVIAAVRSGGQAPAFRALGWDAVIEGDPAALADGVRSATDGAGADVVIDMVGAGLIGPLMEAGALGARIVSVGRLGGFHDTVDLDKLALKRQSLVGVTFRTRSRAQKRAVREAMKRDLMAPLSDGRIVPVVDPAEFALDQALAAQAYMAENRHFGKVVLTV